MSTDKTDDTLPMGRRAVDWEASPDTEQLLLRLEALVANDAFWQRVRDRQIDVLAARLEDEEVFVIECFLDRFEVPPSQEEIDTMVQELVVGLSALGISIRSHAPFSGYRPAKGNYRQLLFWIDDAWRDKVYAH